MKTIAEVLPIGVLLAAITVSLAWAEIPNEKQPPEKRDDVRAVVAGNNAFALDLYAKLRTREGNLFFSPYSISTALAMIYAGARGNTEGQMAQALHFDLGQDRLHPAFSALVRQLNPEWGYELVLANALWGQEGYRFVSPFLELTKKHYGMGLRKVDFRKHPDAARETINTWVEKETRGNIKDLVKPDLLLPETRLVLTNVLYFKGKWASPFEPEYTKAGDFTLLTGKKVRVDMMNQSQDFYYIEDNKVQILAMPYNGEWEPLMIVVLPKKLDGLPALERSLTYEKWSRWWSQLCERGSTEVKVSFPKYKIASAFRLDNALRTMGMTDAFSAAADFSGMNGEKEPLWLSAVIHEAFVAVDEKGTMAAAAAGGFGVGGIAEGPPPVFRADHPFLFLILDGRANSIFFLGRVTNPKN